MTPEIRWHVYPHPDELADALSAAIAIRAEQCITERGGYSIVLTGGTTPRALYARLAEAETDWPRWHIWFGDERCVPPDDDERIEAMARAAWLDHVPIPESQIHPIPGELGPERAAAAYMRALAGVGRFDTTLLGLGADGHTASLFPGRTEGLGDEAPDAVPVRESPKPPPERVSLSAKRLRETGEAVFLVTGAAKREAVARLARLDATIPAARLVPAAGADLWLDDEAAAGIRRTAVADGS